MSLYEPKQLADCMRLLRKNTVAIAEDIPEARCDHRPAHDSVPATVASFLIGAAAVRLAPYAGFRRYLHDGERVPCKFSGRGFERAQVSHFHLQGPETGGPI